MAGNINLPRPQLGRPSDKRVTAEFLKSRNLSGPAFDPAQDIDLLDAIEEKLEEMLALVAYADPALVTELRATAGARQDALDAANEAYQGNAANYEAARQFLALVNITSVENLAATPAGVGLFRYRSGAEAGQVHERATTGGALIRRPDLEIANAAGVQVAQAAASAANTAANTALAAAPYTQTRYGGVAQAVAATPVGDVTRVTSGGAITATVINDGTKGLVGPGIHGSLTGQAALGTNPVLKIQPLADGNVYDLARYESVMASANPAGGDAIQIDVTGNRKMARALFVQMFGRAPNVPGYALNIVNEEAAVNGNNTLTQDAFFCPTFLACHFDGGVKVRGGGDSFSFIATTITGDKGIDVNLQTNVTAWTEASQLLFLSSNITADAGTIIRTGTRTRIAFNNMELKAPGANNYAGAAIQLLGSGLTRYDAINQVTYNEEIENGTIIGNYIGVANARPAVTLGYTHFCQVIYNTLDVGAANTFAVDITPNTRNAIVGPNVIHTTPGYEINDQGKGTMGVWQHFGQAVTGRVNHPLGLGRTAHPQRPFKVIKRPDSLRGAVFLNGSITGGGFTEGDVLATLPVGFRPLPGMYPFVMCLVRTTMSGVAGTLKHHTWAVANPTGELTLGETLPNADTVIEIMFSGQSFESPLI